MSDALRRAIRTLAQFLVSASATAAVNALADGLTPTQKVLVLAGFQFAVTWGHNALEDAPGVPFPAVLKAVASSGTNPVTIDPPTPLADTAPVEAFAQQPKLTTTKRKTPAKKAAAKRAPARKRKDAGLTALEVVVILLVVAVFFIALGYLPAR